MILPDALLAIVKNTLFTYSESDEYKNDMQHPRHMELMAKDMQKYFEDNTVITYAWTAVNTQGTPDPVTTYQGTVKFTPAWNLDMPMSLMPGLSGKIHSSVSGGLITAAAGWTVPPGTFLMLPLYLPQHTVAEECLMECIVRPTCNWIKTLINPAPLAGVHGAYTGTAVMTAIT